MLAHKVRGFVVETVNRLQASVNRHDIPPNESSGGAYPARSNRPHMLLFPPRIQTGVYSTSSLNSPCDGSSFQPCLLNGAINGMKLIVLRISESSLDTMPRTNLEGMETIAQDRTNGKRDRLREKNIIMHDIDSIWPRKERDKAKRSQELASERTLVDKFEWDGK
ncbi:hypothetical protein BDN72DRAFT_435041 [Pluteus cervinus]|uniref:Uncharacterized protein n=1 Tax=Pluteus cervinus TaxID=181527 RepID=A0ACD3A7M7_9AGAR|nr:hypothetical protein BDN72DRAFT_435041 [Pluteus cervinus]